MASGGDAMKNPFTSMLKATRLVNKGRPMSAALVMQRALMTPAKPVSAKKKPAAKATPRLAPRPLPGTTTEGLFESRHGSLRYRLYTPVGSPRRRLPIVVMLHGCSQSAADFANGTAMNALADERGAIILYPEQSTSANVGRCWNWHRRDNQQRGRGEPAVIAALTRHAIALARADPARVYIAGISAGGVAAAIIGQAYPDLFVAVGVHSGLACGEVNSLGAAMAAMRGRATPSSAVPSTTITPRSARPRPTIVFHGDGDRVVHPSNADSFRTQLERSTTGPLVTRSSQGQAAGGRHYSRTEYRNRQGDVMLESWTIHGSGHAWSGGARSASYTDPAGPDASREMLRFFLGRKRLSRPARTIA